jgi:hypothetical protein
MRRIWHPFQAWEEVGFGMWREISRRERDELLPAAVVFTGDHLKYGAAMTRVTLEWPVSCEHNLTDSGQNRRAWIGHAACCLATGAPEYITREAWGHLSQIQRDLANGQADSAIRHWFGMRRGILL